MAFKRKPKKPTSALVGSIPKEVFDLLADVLTLVTDSGAGATESDLGKYIKEEMAYREADGSLEMFVSWVDYEDTL